MQTQTLSAKKKRQLYTHKETHIDRQSSKSIHKSRHTHTSEKNTTHTYTDSRTENVGRKN